MDPTTAALEKEHEAVSTVDCYLNVLDKTKKWKQESLLEVKITEVTILTYFH